ncbi:Vacuolar ATPase assembly integral membrane protein VMA21 [Leucoagaricus sp. SymC.cos]|nr:Vacuolar ATPase assembly integral membrane protein VMA21 [Leucoagaricus sp. SymC.cos]
MSEQAAASRIQTNAASKGVLAKLLLFSVSLGAVPLASYYASLKYFYQGNPTIAAITAVVAANVVLVAYIITSLLEDRKDNAQRAELESKKSR